MSEVGEKGCDFEEMLGVCSTVVDDKLSQLSNVQSLMRQYGFSVNNGEAIGVALFYC